MIDHSEHLRVIRTHPDDDALRLRYAGDLLAEGDPLGELITLQCDPALRDARDPQRRLVLARRARDLTERHGRAWTARVGLGVDDAWFVRGMPEGVRIGIDAFLRNHEVLVATYPIRFVQIWGDARSRLSDLLACSSLSRLSALSLVRTGIDDEACGMLAGARRLRHLRWLDLGANPLGVEGVFALAAAGDELAELEFLGLAGCACDPRATLSEDEWGNGVSVSDLPPVGARIEERYGALAWLRPRPVRPADDTYRWPDPLGFGDAA